MAEQDPRAGASPVPGWPEKPDVDDLLSIVNQAEALHAELMNRRENVSMQECYWAVMVWYQAHNYMVNASTAPPPTA